MVSGERSRKKKIAYKIFIYLLLIGGALFSLLPLYWLIRSSFMELAQIFVVPPIWIPNPIRWENYVQALTVIPIPRYMLNSLIIVIGTVSGAVISSSFCAYAFARLQWKGRDLIFGILLSSIMLPFAVTLIPTFVGWSRIGLTNTFYPLIIPAWFGGGMVNIFLLRQFFRTIPKELDEAATIDGANEFAIFARIIIPLSKPALIVVGLFTFMGTWNDFLGPLVYLTSPHLYTAALGLNLFHGLFHAQWHLMMAASAVVIIPVIVVFFIGQKFFIDGITLTGIKG